MLLSMESPNKENPEGTVKKRQLFSDFLVSGSFEVLIFLSLAGTLLVKLIHAYHYNFVGEYLDYILSDISFLLAVDVIMVLACFFGRRKWLVRTCIIIAAVICTWSFLNAGWLLRTGTQILPRVLLSVFWSPIDSLFMVGANLISMPVTAFVLLTLGFCAILFLIYVLAKPVLPNYKRSLFILKIIVLASVSIIAATIRPAIIRHGSTQPAQVGLRYNAHISAITSLLGYDKKEPLPTGRLIPNFEQIKININPAEAQIIKRNVIVIVLEGVQYGCTSFSGDVNNITPYMSEIAGQGAQFSGTHSILTHTTKALFALLTGRYPSASQDVAETVPVDKPYAGIATILSSKLGYRTAFFQSAKGDFEGRAALVHNLGFEKFWSREQLKDSSAFVGYFGSDEFRMLEPITQWITQSPDPFFLTIMTSVTHDPYEVPDWYRTMEKEKVEKEKKEKVDLYKRAIAFTDSFIAALDAEISRLNLTENTIFCVVGDHGEAFGEHGLLGHERIGYEEAIHVPFCIRAPSLIKPSTVVTSPVSSVDLTPTVLTLLGLKTQEAGFDGINVLSDIPADRKVYFTSWMQESPAGYIQAGRKYIYDSMQKSTYAYDLITDHNELVRIDLPQEQANIISENIINWRDNTIFRINQKQTGSLVLFDEWFCRWADRNTVVKLRKESLGEPG
jgi:phosphoglycerol transferase MdoB-like AlkP superfamily enzyme